MVTLENAKASKMIKLTLDAMSSRNAPDGTAPSTWRRTASTNVLIISGPPERVDELVTAGPGALDVSEPVTPTVTEAIKLNYAEPDDVSKVVETMLSDRTRQGVAVDARGRHVIVTDVPAVVEQVRALVQNIDIAHQAGGGGRR
jgi:type II secretory pathway component GspD/PulD (secretin)